MPTKDVSSQVYMASATTYNFTLFTRGMNTGLVKYIVTDENNNDINQWNGALPFIRFDTKQFTLTQKKLGFAIYTYIP